MTRNTVGVLALQGGVAEHASMLEHLGARVVLVRRESELWGPEGARLDALVLPGGESSTQDRLMRLLDLRAPLAATLASGVPTLGTCAGLILLAQEVLDPAPGQGSFGVLDVCVRRNALGAQVASAEAEFAVDATGVIGEGTCGAVRGALIRAPEIVACGSEARPIVTHAGRVLGATSRDFGATDEQALGRITAIAFHPELSGDPAFHRSLLAQA